MKPLKLAVLFALVLSAPALAFEKPAQKHMIAAASPYATQAGLEILRAGGSAVDAAIATQMVLTLVEPESSGIGGGAFMLLYDKKTGRITSFDGRETAPASATPTMFLDASGQPRAHFDAVPGGLSVGIPGDIAMFEMAHKKYGKLPWAKLFAPAIKLSEKGFEVSDKLAAEIRAFPQMAQMPDFKAYLTHKDGTPLAAGETLKNPELAKTLRLIAKGGAKVFYSGAIAQAIIDKVNNAPVNRTTMTLADFASYRAVEREPVCGTYRDHKLCSMGPPSSGGIAVLQILGMLERFNETQLKPNSLSEVHLSSEASRLAFADRAKYLGDPDVINVPISGLIDSNYLHDRSKLIDEHHDMGQAQAGNPPNKRADYAPQRTPQLPGTSHFSIVDDSGQVVSMTTTIEFAFGSEMMANGFFLNNELTDFSFEAEHDGKPVANAPGPGKRPMSAMSPTIVFQPDGSFWIATGSPGGPVIIPYVTESLIALIDGHQTPQQAAALPHHANMNGPTILEQDTPLASLAPDLTAMGHTVRLAPLESGLHIIEKTKYGYIGGADVRRPGNMRGD
ncbi:MAG TPA: gamma-glutamyltransferase [Rhizomicrobium sp.]|jgi:gamma-glutamyltranspeptidase/glutathione hydrolase